MKHDEIRAAAFAIDLNRRGEPDAAGRLVGLLADARVWCDLNGRSFAELDRCAYQHYLALLSDATTGKSGRRP
jgi:hypothetical protein